jgi:sulfur-oxidizing protein SoxX
LQFRSTCRLKAGLAALTLAVAAAPTALPADDVQLAQGKKLAMSRSKGNCLACHAFDDGELPGTIGPPLLYMQQRFPDRDTLRAQIWDPTVRNPDTVMPPFGRHAILTETEIDLIVDYIHTL